MKRKLIIIILIMFLLAGFSALALAGSATLHWQSNNEPDLSGYRIYYGTASRSYGPYIPVGKTVNTYVLNGLNEEKIYFFALTAVDTAGNESGYSAEVRKSISGAQSPPVDTSGNQPGQSGQMSRVASGGQFSTSPVNTRGKVSGADFDGDGSADIVFRNHRTGDTQILLVKGENYDTEFFSIPRVSDKNWKMSGTGDFNKDGSVDIVWRNYRTGDNGIWLMNGTTSEMNKVSLPRFSNTDWHIEGTGDFNKDGNVDILWRNYHTGDNMIWPMNGTRYEMSTPVLSLPRVSDLDWHIKGVGDYNKDGNVDIVWQNYRTGGIGIWLMNGTKFTVGNGVWLTMPPT